MDFLYAFLGGISCKLYDDLNDNQMIGPRVQEILKGTQWILLALLSHNDFNFAVINFIMNALNASNNWGEWKHPYESSLLLLTPIFLLTSLSTRMLPGIYDAIYVAIFVISMAVEPLFIHEEFSYRKLIIRLVYVIGTIVGVVFLNDVVSNSFLKLGYYGIGYLSTSVCFQAYMLWQKNESVSVEER
jgi:hypothetical protein